MGITSDHSAIAKTIKGSSDKWVEIPTKMSERKLVDGIDHGEGPPIISFAETDFRAEQGLVFEAHETARQQHRICERKCAEAETPDTGDVKTKTQTTRYIRD